MEKIVELMKGDNTIDVPTKQEILQYALETKIQTNVARIYEIVEAVKQDDMEKGLKETAIAAAMMGASALSPTSISTDSDMAPTAPTSITQPAQKSNLSKMPKEHQEFYKKVAKKNPILGAIGAVESSGGINYDHEPIKSKGMHQGHVAGGMFGMMPHAAEYILRKHPELAKKYPKLAEAAKDIKANHGQFTEAFNSSPQTAADFAEALLSRNKTKTKNMDMLIHSWNHGLKGTWDKYKQDPKSLKNADYVKSVFKALKEQKTTQPIKKALTAGYGGAGVPTGNVGGGVLQSEALDGGKHKGFKYTTCDNCGKEQIYAKFQVKCRDCGKNWSLDKLHKILHSKSG
jgi:hypothetical protein